MEIFFEKIVGTVESRIKDWDKRLRARINRERLGDSACHSRLTDSEYFDSNFQIFQVKLGQKRIGFFRIEIRSSVSNWRLPGILTDLTNDASSITGYGRKASITKIKKFANFMNMIWPHDTIEIVYPFSGKLARPVWPPWTYNVHVLCSSDASMKGSIGRLHHRGASWFSGLHWSAGRLAISESRLGRLDRLEIAIVCPF